MKRLMPGDLFVLQKHERAYVLPLNALERDELGEDDESYDVINPSDVLTFIRETTDDEASDACREIFCLTRFGLRWVDS